ncbi:hypothetical protein FHT77_002562 [Rhizobium sp. BK181]|uniref:hypothetical protein n=1 Tax=Rhizobium sp. BK181 TaxID=2587072 RepID=UPI001615ABAB|nr:hypothetical protein [Rhizobium sp. BK181]MBB3316681.1 hypothetical protein [Rhizobium sp. BK181]
MDQNVQGRLYNTVAVLGYLMGIVAPGNQWRQHLLELMDSCPLADENAMGFPHNWKNLSAFVFNEGLDGIRTGSRFRKWSSDGAREAAHGGQA